MHIHHSIFHFVWIFSSIAGVCSIRHGQNLIWAQVPSLRNSVSRLVGIEGDPDEWVVSGKVKIRHISAPHLGWEFSALAFDYTTQTLIWSEAMNKRIQSLVLNGSTDTSDVFTGTSPEVYGMAVDWQSGNLYWTDALYNWIIMAPLHARNKTRTYKIIIQTGLDSPHGIAVHTTRGLLIWSDFGERPRIEMSDLLGGDRHVLVDQSLEHPRAITLDGDTLYWVDSQKDTVEAVNIDGTERRIVVVHSGSNFFGIAAYGDYLFVTEQSKGHLKIVDKDDGQNKISYRLGYIPYDIIMYTNYTTGSSHRCDMLQCEQFCVDMPDPGARCICGEGFNITDDGRSCELTEQFVQPSHIYAVHDAICHYPANVADMSLLNVTLDKQCFLDKRHGYLALAFDARENFLYYSENNTKTISRINLEVGATAETVAGGTGVVAGLCLDWVSGNLYWTDSSSQLIKVASRHGTFQRDLITTNLDNPLGIAVHPGRGRLYFTDPGDTPKVETAYTDGSDRRTILDYDLGSPNHLYIDYTNDMMYWSDSIKNHVRRYNLETEQLTIVFRLDNTGFYGISIFQDIILWTDRNDMNGIHMARLDKEEKIRGILHPHYGIAQDLVTFDVNNQPLFNSSCREGSNPCSQLCLSGAEDATWCTCGLGYQLAEDDVTCISSIAGNNFLLVTDAYQRQVFQVSSSNGVVHAVRHSTRHSPIAIGFDPIKMRLYWSDNTVHIIKGSNLDGDFAEIVVGMDDEAVVDGLAVDHINKLLYFTDAGHNLIGVVSLTNYTHHTILLTEDVDEPRAIALLPLEGIFFWTDWGVEPRIERASMDGSDRSTFVSLDKNSWPNGLAVDSKSRRLFWVDAQFNTVSMIFLNGTGQRVMLKEDVAHYFGITIMGDYLYLTDWKKTYISRMHKEGGALEEFGTDSFTKLYGIYGFNRTEVVLGNSVCVFKECQQLCLPRPHNMFTCACMEGFRLNDDRRTCIQETTPAPATTRLATTPTTTSPNAATTSTTVKATSPSIQTTLMSSPSSVTSLSSSTTVKSPVTSVIPAASPGLSSSTPKTFTSQNSITGAPTSKHPTTEYEAHEPAAPVSTTQSRLSSGTVAAVVIVVLLACIIAVVVAVVIYRKHRQYKIPHGKLLEDDPQRVDTFYRITFPDNNKDEPVMIDNGIENPAYDCVSDDDGDKDAYNVH
ncbi:low-density lipoprotein receptor-related protein 4-like [Haliotis rubra]|uniref:low-density lipoprotein receptor-related protein 4-like n=1 Tax=Haliotis rubra TaxID=36100 RepID=UPI001EE56215|nr:low-density lipoprotein receptor-related protein 4-like [Haliotis rubra]